MNSRLKGGEPISPQHVKEGRFAGVVEAEEEDFAGLVLQSQVLEDIGEPVINEHWQGGAGQGRSRVKADKKDYRDYDY